MTQEIIVKIIYKILLENYGISKEKFRSKSQEQELVDLKKVVVQVLRFHCKVVFTCEEIGKLINRKHCNVSHLTRAHKEIIKVNLKYQKLFSDFKLAFQNYTITSKPARISFLKSQIESNVAEIENLLLEIQQDEKVRDKINLEKERKLIEQFQKQLATF